MCEVEWSASQCHPVLPGQLLEQRCEIHGFPAPQESYLVCRTTVCVVGMLQIGFC